ncbi:conserved protein of unknown function [Limnospira indica PCC 8005]|uniref:Uncharacterized protein n=1 Tax=Limnospira indica PCC 8005 TaxID=376219 RepID=A0A9P1KE45_9CYAN|nr:conserved protein of unknown function [Limnospira indica PCC 8005]
MIQTRFIAFVKKTLDFHQNSSGNGYDKFSPKKKCRLPN